jgi:hypothetical protein
MVPLAASSINVTLGEVAAALALVAIAESRPMLRVFFRGYSSGRANPWTGAERRVRRPPRRAKPGSEITPERPRLRLSAIVFQSWPSEHNPPIPVTTTRFMLPLRLSRNRRS